MTKVQIEYELQRGLDDAMMDRIAKMHGVYGIERVGVHPSLRSLLVEYDASRLSAKDVESVLDRAGIPVMTRA